METLALCPRCQLPLPADAPRGLCPTCLLRQALDSHGRTMTPAHSQATPADPDRIDQYVIQGKIGRGGMGVIYRARDLNTERIVALKMIIAGRLASEWELQRFRTEAEAAANLDHPNIVPIYDVGQHDGMPYYTMKLMEGGSLADHVSRFSDPPDAARLVATVAWAVHFGHQRGVLHRDIKPANILLDAAWQPHVSDFSLAKRVEKESGLTRSGAIFGTPSYMSPEQAAGKTRQLTVGADIYSLGAVLYELLCGRPPFAGDSAVDTIQQVIHQEPPRPSALSRRIDRDLETICLKCLEKDPSRRYGSAEDMGKELERYLKGQPIKARYIGRTQRVWRWCLRFPLWAGFIASAAVFLIIMTIAALVIARDQEQARRRDALDTNLFAARHVAATVLWQLQQYSQAVQKNARDAELRGLLAVNARPAAQDKRLASIIAAIHRDSNAPGSAYRPAGEAREPFESWFLLDGQGRGVVRSPPPQEPSWTGASFAGREYFQAAMEHARRNSPEPHVSRVFQSYADKFHKFAIVMPIKASDDSDAPVVGVLAATITTGAALGSLDLGDQNQLRKVVIVGPRDTNPRTGTTLPSAPPAPRDPEYLVLFHEAYEKQRPTQAPQPIASPALLRFATQLQRSEHELRLPRLSSTETSASAVDDQYVDPIAGGRWLAGFAQVGHSELVVLVQTRYEDAIGHDKTTAKRLAFWAGLALAIGLVILTVAAGYAHRKQLRRHA